MSQDTNCALYITFGGLLGASGRSLGYVWHLKWQRIRCSLVVKKQPSSKGPRNIEFGHTFVTLWPILGTKSYIKGPPRAHFDLISVRFWCTLRGPRTVHQFWSYLGVLKQSFRPLWVFHIHKKSLNLTNKKHSVRVTRQVATVCRSPSPFFEGLATGM